MLFSAAFAGFTAGAGLIIAIGAQNAFVLRQGLQRTHLGAVVAICVLGDIALIMSGIAGIAALAQQSPWLLRIVQLAGAIFVGGYGLLAARRAWQGSGMLVAASEAATSRTRIVLACLAFTFLNPHVYVDTVLLLGSLASHYAGAERWIFAAGACTASALWFSLLGYGARWLSPLFGYRLAWRLLDALVAVMMLTLSVLLLYRPLSG